MSLVLHLISAAVRILYFISFSMNLDQFVIQRHQFLAQGAKCLYFCSHFYAAFKNEEKLIVGPFIMTSLKFKEAILGCQVCIGKIYSQFRFNFAGPPFHNECFSELRKHFIQFYTGNMHIFWYLVKSKVWFFLVWNGYYS